MQISLERSQYTVREHEYALEVCVAVTGAGERSTLAVYICTEEGSATGLYTLLQ